MRRIALASLLTIAGHAAAQPARPVHGEPTVARGPGATRAMGYYDATMRRVVLVGGAGPASARGRDRVWSWSGRRWEPVTDSGPAARGNAAAAYDVRRAMAVVAGGTRRAMDDSTWESVGETWQSTPSGWRRMTGADLEPRDHHAMVYDGRRESVLLFGGTLGDRSGRSPGDTWELRPEGWVRVAVDGPPGRARGALAYDAARRQVVLFGGVGSPPGVGQPQPFLADTWLWDGAAWRKAAEGGPRGRYAHGMAYDERAGVVLLYGGAAAHRGAPLSDMWQWDGARWTEIPLSGATPGYRYQPVMAYDRARGRTVLYGGLDGSHDDTWEWDGRRWTRIDP